MRATRFHWWEAVLCLAVTLAVTLVCVCVGSVALPLRETSGILLGALRGETLESASASILLRVRLPRVLAVALIGASLSLCGASMQGLLRNPLADGSTLGVSSGASLGAAVAIVTGFTLPGLPIPGTAVMAMVFAFAALVAILSLSYALDSGLSTHTILLFGVVFSMLVTSLLSLLIAFSGEKLRSITFWTMGSLSGVGYPSVGLLLAALVLGGGVLLSQATALNAFTMGETRALHLGIPVRRVKLTVMITVSALVGVCVSVGGGIGFVGLATPHMVRFLSGPNHKRLLPYSVFGGAVFLLLCDLAARTALAPVELPIGVVTSLIGAGVFFMIYIRSRKRRRRP